MAIVQISQITNRKGLQADLPQLAGAELGWSIDERRLFIGNGTLQEGAPVIGNTEILTEFSDILAFQTNYTYKGEAAGYTVQTGPTLGTPVSLSLQTWLDQFASVKDFGAVGDGIADDTDAINRALYQLFCRQANPQIRRSLFFPAGVYRVTESILIPPYATLVGDGIEGSIIRKDDGADSALTAYVARTCDSLQQTGVNIGNNGAVTPQYVTITNMGFQNLDLTTDVFLVEDANNCRFQNVSFAGALTKTTLTSDIADIACIRFASTSSLVCEQIVFDGCRFSGATYAVNTDQQLKAVTFSNGYFDTFYQGFLIGTGTVVNGGATGLRITQNIFDNIYSEGIILGDVSLNATGYNIFYDVGNHFLGIEYPATVIIDIQSNNNVSIGDMFARSDADSIIWDRIQLNTTTSIGVTNSKQMAIGNYVRETGTQFTMLNDTSGTVFSVDAVRTRAFSVDYTILRNVDYRTGTFIVATDSGASDLTWSDDYVENIAPGVTLSAQQVGDTVDFDYQTTDTGVNASFTYSITHLA